MDSLRVVVSGCGLATELLHLPALNRLAPDVDVVGLVDPSAFRREVCGELAPSAAMFADLREALTVQSPTRSLSRHRRPSTWSRR